ncbi:MAG: 4Fe-4S dicluster domain-containing protein [Bacteroidales bacterium]|nr:4Fe-4S dicluster domain-containing protein [Bacteroidales bacterium]
MEPLVKIDQQKCTTCYTCLRVCPVKAVKINESNKHPEISVKRCIGCGDCITSCYPGAISYRSDIENAKELLQSGQDIAFICSPSISAEFNDITDYRKFVSMLRSLGAKYVNEVSFAVDIIAYKYLHLFNDFKGKYYITTYDPVVVSYIEKYHPNLISNLAPMVSPMIACAMIMHKIYGENIKIIYIGPEIARKEEALRHKGDAKIDVVLTFLELRQLFEEYSLDESTIEFSDFDPPIGYKGSLYPLANGIIQAADMDENRLTSDIITIEGRKPMLESIQEFENNVKTIHRHLNVTYGNSLYGPGLTKHGNKLLKEHLVIEYANKRLNNFFRHEWYNNLQSYMELDFSCSFKNDDQRLPEPQHEKVLEILDLLNRNEDDVLGCDQCGYESCKAFAEDIARGLATPEMCSSYAFRSSMNFEESLKHLNEKLSQTRKALKESEENAKKERTAAKQASDFTNAMLEKLRAGVVIYDFQMKVLQSNTAFINILGEEAKEINEVIPGLAGADLKRLLSPGIMNLFTYVLTEGENIESRDIMLGEIMLNISVFPIVKNRVAGAIIRDMRAPEVQKAEAIKRISEVIDKNLEMVQKIGFLMGEGASDIEKMLNSIIKFYNEGNGTGK